MKISIINGSPKLGKSNTQQYIDYLVSEISDKNEITIFNIIKDQLNELEYDVIRKSNTIIFAFPLYIDSIPSHLLRFMARLENMSFFKPDTMVYCIVNNGFFEGKQNHISIQQMKIWCKKTNLKWGQSIGVGAGEMLPFVSDIPLGHGPNKNLGNAINNMSSNILSSMTGDDILISPNWPRFLWKLQASMLVWNPRAKANGLKKRDVYKKIIDSCLL